MGLAKKKSRVALIIFGVSIIAVFSVVLTAIFVAEYNSGRGMTKPADSEIAPETAIVKIDAQEIPVEIAATPAATYRGLSDRPSLAPGCGMLFNFNDKQKQEFVMRDMNFPLDIIFIAAGKIIKIAADLPPEGHNPANIYDSGAPADQVLEVNGGYCREKGINVGDNVLVNK